MKNILVNAYLEKNLGDDLFLKILFDRYPNVKWFIDTTDYTYKEVFKNYKNVDIIGTKMYRIMKKIGLQRIYTNKCDAVVFIGGSIFIQFNEWEVLHKYRETLFNLFKRKEKYIIGSNFGPYKDQKFIDKNKELFNKCTDICFRDSYSYDLFKELKNVRVNPDIVFQLKSQNRNKIKDSIGISIIDLEDREDLARYNKIYCEKIKEIVEHLISKGKSITFFSFCESQGDMKAINNIINLVDNKFRNKINTVNYTGNIDKFLSEFESMENIIGTRFHACILSQVFGQGLYPIIYSDKTYNVLKDIGLDSSYSFIKNIENIDIDNMIDIISNNKIKDKCIFKDAEKQFKGLDKYVNG